MSGTTISLDRSESVPAEALPREIGATGDVGDGMTQVREMSRRSALVFWPRSHRRAGTRAETTCPTAGYLPTEAIGGQLDVESEVTSAARVAFN